jgi:hypothetical protein
MRGFSEEISFLFFFHFVYGRLIMQLFDSLFIVGVSHRMVNLLMRILVGGSSVNQSAHIIHAEFSFDF